MSKLVPFEYQGQGVEVMIDENGKDWYVADDVCKILEYANTVQALEKLPASKKLIYGIHRSGQKRKLWLVSQAGLFLLILRCTKPQAEPFQDWVTEEVIPAIVKQGYYSFLSKELDLVSRYTLPECKPWVKTFPDEFFKQIYRLHNWEYKPGKGHLQYVGSIINEYIYAQLPSGVLDYLKTTNPRNEQGKLKFCHHQLLSDEYGVKHLQQQLITVTSLMQSAYSWLDFKQRMSLKIGCETGQTQLFMLGFISTGEKNLTALPRL